MNRETIFGRRIGMRVLMFHGVAHTAPPHLRWRERKYWMSTAEFRSHVYLLKRMDETVEDLANAWMRKIELSGKNSRSWQTMTAAPVVLTFDDGHGSDAALAWPLLQEAGLPATFFVNTATLDQRGYLRWTEVKEMSASGARFGSHGHRHIDLISLETSVLRDELRTSKGLLEDRLGLPIHFLSVPYGRVNEKVITEALAAGYSAVCTSTPELAIPGACTVNRVAIHAGTTRADLSRIIAGKRLAYLSRRARAVFLSLPKKFLLVPGSGQEIKAGGAQ